MTTITFDIPDEISTQFNNLEELRRTLYEDLIIMQRQCGHLSLGKAAELLGLTYSELFQRLGQKGFSFINATPEELEQSYQRLATLMEQPP
jgi:predicted HTH domain antitoxin